MFRLPCTAYFLPKLYYAIKWFWTLTLSSLLQNTFNLKCIGVCLFIFCFKLFYFLFSFSFFVLFYCLFAQWNKKGYYWRSSFIVLTRICFFCKELHKWVEAHFAKRNVPYNKMDNLKGETFWSGRLYFFVVISF